MSWHLDATGAARRAGILRGRLGYGLADALCPFDVAERLKVEVRLQNESPRMEGFYAPGRPPRIFISSLRPPGRQRYTAAHELGHHEYGHGASLDAELNDNTREEFLANRFARALLMPKLVVASAYQRRGWDPRQTSAEQAFVVAQDLGVGFTTLIDNMSQTLRLLGRDEADLLTKLRLPKVRVGVAGHEVEHDFFPVDDHWGKRPLDVQVGDVIAVPVGAVFSGASLGLDAGRARALRAGRAQLHLRGRGDPIEVRVSRREFAGRAKFRHLEDPDDE